MLINGYSKYSVDKLGNVKGPKGLLKPHARSTYLRVWIKSDLGQKHYVPIHKIVLLAFVGPRPPNHHAAHKDGDTKNNRLSNLEWKLPTENEADKKKHGTAPRGGHFPPSHPKRVKAILRLVASNYSYTKIAKRFNIHRHSVSRIARGIRRKVIQSSATI